MLLLAALIVVPATAIAQQNQSPPRPQPAGQPAGNQSPATPGNQTPAAPQPPPGIPLYINPGIVQQIQLKLLSLGLPVPTVSGAWGDNSAAAIRTFQTKNGIDAGGDLDELTLDCAGHARSAEGRSGAGRRRTGERAGSRRRRRADLRQPTSDAGRAEQAR